MSSDPITIIPENYCFETRVSSYTCHFCRKPHNVSSAHIAYCGPETGYLMASLESCLIGKQECFKDGCISEVVKPELFQQDKPCQVRSYSKDLMCGVCNTTHSHKLLVLESQKGEQIREWILPHECSFPDPPQIVRVEREQEVTATPKKPRKKPVCTRCGEVGHTLRNKECWLKYNTPITVKKEKRSYKCSICKLSNHTKAKCPSK